MRTFKPRRRRLSESRQRAFERLAPIWSIATGGTSDDVRPAGDSSALTDPSSFFGNEGPIVLDIGIGIGESCIEMAAADPSTNIIGVDVHTPGIANALIAIDELGLTNLRVFHGDVFELSARLQPGSLAGIRAYFPDPWPKPRHHRRRLINGERLPELVGLLGSGGWIHLATDAEDYAAQMVEVCDADPALTGGPIERPNERPLTRFERRGIDAGRSIVDLWYQRVDASYSTQAGTGTPVPIRRR